MSTTLERLECGFDRASRRTWCQRVLATGEDYAYGYDGLSQVVQAARGNLNVNATAIGGVPAEAQGWDYDPTGNWRGYETKTNGSVVLAQARVHDRGNRLTQIAGAPSPVLLDRAGRMREVSPDAGGNWNQAQQVKWDAWSRVTEVRRKSDGAVLGSYSYDGLSRRTTQSVGGTTTHTYYSDAWRPLEERLNNQTTAARQYYWGARHRDDLVRRDRATTSGGPLSETRYVLMDYFSPAAITDQSGTVKERYAFSAFGMRRILTPAFGDRATSECDFTFAFQGQFLDTESGFLNYGYRYYSPQLGRWLSKDPIEEEGGANLYGFAENNPVNEVDYLGLQAAALAGGALLGEAGAGVGAAGLGATLGAGAAVAGTAVGGFLLGREIGEDIVDSGVIDWTFDTYDYWKNRRSRWTCYARCNVQKIKEDACCPDRVTGVGHGPSRGAAENDAEHNANGNVPRGCYKRHCSFKLL